MYDKSLLKVVYGFDGTIKDIIHVDKTAVVKVSNLDRVQSIGPFKAYQHNLSY